MAMAGAAAGKMIRLTIRVILVILSYSLMTAHSKLVAFMFSYGDTRIGMNLGILRQCQSLQGGVQGGEMLSFVQTLWYMPN